MDNGSWKHENLSLWAYLLFNWILFSSTFLCNIAFLQTMVLCRNWCVLQDIKQQNHTLKRKFGFTVELGCIEHGM